EAQTLEEPAVAAGVVASLEQLPHQLLRLGLLRRIRDVDAAAELPRQVHVVPRRQKVFVIHDTQEHAHARAALDGALAHATDNLLRVLLHAGDQRVAVGTLFALRIGVLHNHRLLAGVAAGRHDHHLARLEELHWC
ncbi:hypothetical protein TcCL_NonESM11042, partial [Trypanosoma cruzi]